jgi:signal transduction histidine kinase
MGRRFFWRVGCLAFVLFALFVAIMALGFLIWGGHHWDGNGGDGQGWNGWNGPPIGGIILLLIGAFIVYRFLRHTAAPASELMEATGRLAEGDYSTRVQPNGSSESRDLARAFNALAERLETNESRRRALIADVTHELRTPLSVIRGAAEGIVDGVYPGDAAHLTPIVEEVEMMARLLDDLAMLSTAEAGLLTLTKERVDIYQLVSEQVAAFRPAFDARGVSVENTLPATLPAVEADPLRLRQVLSNLLANALQHSAGGDSVRVEGEAAPPDGVELRVVDTGAGIPPDQLPHIFERFRKADDSPGSGLGLAIARSLVEAHGGRISAASVLGEGTTITIELPAS